MSRFGLDATIRARGGLHITCRCRLAGTLRSRQGCVLGAPGHYCPVMVKGAFIPVGSEEAPIEGLASVRHSNGTCSFPAFRFHEWLREVRREGISGTRLPCPPESGPSASDLRTSNDRIVSSKRDVRVFHKGNFPSSRSFLIYLDRSKLDPFTNVLPRTTLDPPSPVTRVIRLALQVLLRSPTPGGASLPISLSLIGSLTWFKTRTPTGLLGSRMNLPYRAASKHLGAMGE